MKYQLDSWNAKHYVGGPMQLAHDTMWHSHNDYIGWCGNTQAMNSIWFLAQHSRRQQTHPCRSMTTGNQGCEPDCQDCLRWQTYPVAVTLGK
jgi:hypothetical protein